MIHTADTEREKYRRAFQTDAYRHNSPGERIAPTALRWAREIGAESVTDYGCGKGGAMQVFRRDGLRVLGVDIMGREAGAEGEVWAACLWELPDDLPPTDFCFSADVLEHLPEEWAEEAIRQMAERTRLGGFLQIATRPDSIGAEIGAVLHLTVQPADWWKERVARHFKIERARLEDHGAVQLWVRK